ncbi:uncharacterized protein EDB91DRAFT_1235854 [Suillus paluster]|uniref:uncharacterized protein n=1 Tax=Suillus paluster TaxID=48578 RepID=UPI001B85FB79|nr:uncharacterized protein EDB91DRAFT_1235854 [Suillus paluster]KAG1747038.1 hypothetical protein EDB91DRAFT_1235854 [Suillus paluster]
MFSTYVYTGDPPPSGTVSPAPQYNIDDIKVEYHPSSGIPTKVYHFEDYGRGPGAPPAVPEADPMPWQPLRTCIDFEVAELAHDAGLSHEQLDRLIHLIHRSRIELFTLKNCKDVRDMWDAASFKMTPFTKEEVIVPFRGVDRTFPLFHRSLWDWVTDLLQDPQVGPNFVFDAQRLSKFNGKKFVWFIHEPWTANVFWEYQSKIPPDAKPLAFILYADKAKLSSFGHVKGYPVVARCANLPIAICNGKGLGGGHIVGWLPIVKEDKQHSGKPAFVNFKNAVWHALFLKILDCLAPLSRFGSAIKCWDDVIRVFYPIVLILSADYEEQAVMALIHGLMGKFPCPVCLVPRDELSNTLKVFPLHTCTETKALLARARESSTLDAREQILSSQSLHDVDSSFGVLEHTNVHRALSHNKLHFNDEGLFRDHTWSELQKWVERLGRQAAVQIDNFFQSIPHWRNLNHFNQVISVSFTDRTKYEDISKLIVFAAHNVFDRDMDLEAYLLLRCIRSYVEFNMYASLEVHTEDTINNGREALSKLTGLMDDTAEMSEKSWNFPKKHLSAHLFDDIEAKGVSRNYSTKPNKKMHGPLKDAYQDRTNFKNFDEQILRYNHDSLIAQYIRNKLDHLDTQNLSISDDLEDQPDTALQETDNSDDIDVDSMEPTDAQHFTLGSKQVAMSFTLIEAGSPGNPAFDRFQIKLNDFLNHAFAANSIPFPGGRRIQLIVSDMVMSTDYLRCTLMFHGSLRYDCVILQTNTGIIFGKLMLILTCTVGDVQYPVTLDKDFQFWRVKRKPRASAEFFSVHSIVWGCMIVEDVSRPDKFLIVDTIDTDMFLRMQDICSQ